MLGNHAIAACPIAALPPARAPVPTFDPGAHPSWTATARPSAWAAVERAAGWAAAARADRWKG